MLWEVALLTTLLLAPEAVVYFLFHRAILTADTLTSNLPLKYLAVEQLLAGRLPLWTSKLGNGYPLLADTISLPFDWRNLFFAFLRPPAAYLCMVLASRILGAAVCLQYLRLRHGLRLSAAVPATLVYFCSTVYFGESRLHSTAAALDALPAVIWLAERLFDRPSLRRGLAIAFLFALISSMTSIAYEVYLPVAVLVWIGGLWLCGERRVRQLVVFGSAFAGAVLWSLPLYAVGFVPFFELLQHSGRGGEYITDPWAFRSVWGAIFGALPGSQLIAPFTSFMYVGVVSLPLILATIGRRDNRYVRAVPLLMSATLAVLLLLTSPLKPRLVQVLPVLATVPFFRPFFFWGFLAAVAVGYALDRSSWELGTRKRALAAGLFAIQLSMIAMAAIIVAWLIVYRVEDETREAALRSAVAPFAPFLFPTFSALVVVRFLGLGLALLPAGRRLSIEPGRLSFDVRTLVGFALVAELLLTWMAIRPMHRIVSGTFPMSPEVRYLKSVSDPNDRVLGILSRPEWGDPLPGNYEQVVSLYLDAQAYHGLWSANSYESLVLANDANYFSSLGDVGYRARVFPRAPNAVLFSSVYRSPLIAALGVKYLISDRPLPPDADATPLVQGDAYYVYQLNDPMPRAYFVSRAERMSYPAVEQKLADLASGAAPYDLLRREVLITGGDAISGPGAPVFRSAVVLDDNDESVRVAVDAPTDGYLVLTDQYYPGWSVKVDGQDRRIELANGFGRAVEVGPGPHTLVFTYRPASFVVGAYVSLASVALSFLGLLGWAVWRRWRPRQAGGVG